jgi:putative transposase
MVDLCREFGITRPTGYKFWKRYKALGPEGLGDFSKRPRRHPNRTPEEIEHLLLTIRREHPTWGPKKLRAHVEREHPGVPVPAVSTIGELLKRKGLVRPRRRRRRCTPTLHDKLTQPLQPNDVWCADFKGQFRTGDRKYCYPLTITDGFSRFLIACESLQNTRTDGAYAAFAQAFRAYGLPRVIRTDNGTPFASTGLEGLARLSVWWMRLGIRPERIEPGQPQQNGSHERMHLTLKEETTRPPRANLLQQQERFDEFRRTFNEVRPHEALDMKRPADLYEPATDRPFPGVVEEARYPLHDKEKKVWGSGHINMGAGWYPFLSASLSGEVVGVRELEQGRWIVDFLDRRLGELRKGDRCFVPQAELATRR